MLKENKYVDFSNCLTEDSGLEKAANRQTRDEYYFIYGTESEQMTQGTSTCTALTPYPSCVLASTSKGRTGQALTVR